MPRRTRPNLKPVNIRIPQEQIEEAERIADALCETSHSVIRSSIREGLPIVASKNLPSNRTGHSAETDRKETQ